MLHPAHRASYKRGCKLVALGCPLPYLDSLPRDPAKFCKTLSLREVGGYTESRVFNHGPGRATDYLIALRIGTDLPRGIVVANWSFNPPWGEHLVCWDYDPEDIVPERDRDCYAKLMDNARLLAVLNDRQLLTRGHAVEGLLCGRADKPIAEASVPGPSVSGELTVIVDTGQAFSLQVQLTVISNARRIAPGKPRAGLFERRSVVRNGSLL